MITPKILVQQLKKLEKINGIKTKHWNRKSYKVTKIPTVSIKLIKKEKRKMKTTKKLTQTDVLEAMLLNNQLVTGSTIYKETKRLTGCGSLNLHVIIRPLKKKYNIKGFWCVDKKGNRFKSWEIVNYKNVKKR